MHHMWSYDATPFRKGDPILWVVRFFLIVGAIIIGLFTILMISISGSV